MTQPGQQEASAIEAARQGAHQPVRGNRHLRTRKAEFDKNR